MLNRIFRRLKLKDGARRQQIEKSGSAKVRRPRFSDGRGATGWMGR